ncbi:hypothetical protein BGZ83_004098, partial [Gryganskiella cystojenkinii]
VKIYDTFKETEEVEEVVDESAIPTEIVCQAVVEPNKEVAVETIIPTSTTIPKEYRTHDAYHESSSSAGASIESDYDNESGYDNESSIESAYGAAMFMDSDSDDESSIESHYGAAIPIESDYVDGPSIESDYNDESAISNGTSRHLLEFRMSGLPPSLGDLTMESLVTDMKTSPVFDDQTFGAMDLEEEPDILVFLVDRVFEDPDYTKRLMWTVYKSSAERVVNQSTKNAKCILEKAGIQFQPMV